jgi:tRNA dimethylallyltransferase
LEAVPFFVKEVRLFFDFQLYSIMYNNELITVLGPTACGKTALAAALAAQLDTEIISADSRQVYRRMDIGTGKDLCDYIIDGKQINYHLIDICELPTKYNVFEYQHDFHKVFENLRNAGKIPILCGGTGMYIEAVLKGFRLFDVPPDNTLRESLKNKSLQELKEILSSYKTLHNKTDVDSAQRAIRAIEIEEYYKTKSPEENEYKAINSLIIGIDISREDRREKITSRLHARLENGMIEEISNLLKSGIKPEDLIYYGLEYKYVTQYIIGELTYNEMVEKLEIAIHQFAKRQMTWFRGMERRGLKINWIDYTLNNSDKIKKILEIISK